MIALPEARHASGAGADVRLFCEALGCIGYSFSLDPSGALILDWVVGSISDVVALPIRDFLAGEFDGQALQLQGHLDKLSAGNASQVDLVWNRGGHTLRLRDAAQPDFDSQGRLSRIVGTVRDISGEVWARQDSALEIWQHRIAEYLDQGLACWDTDHRLALVNRRFRGLLGKLSAEISPGVSAEEFIAAAARSGQFAIEEPTADWIERTLRDFHDARAREHRLSDGRWIEIAPIPMSEGTILRIQDISTRKGGERALRQAKEIAETANLKKSRFLRAANHDLRQPLATLKILIYSSFGVAADADRLDMLHSMDVTVGIMEEILGSLLQIGQLDAGRIATRVVNFQISQSLERLKIEFGPQAAVKGLKLRVVACHVTVESDRALLERVLSNFIANAIRFTETGTILLGARRRGGHIDIEVWDTGCGIAADQLELIFEEFHQVADQLSHRQRGLGLGLNIAHRLAELLEHRINVRSKVGAGSMFSISVPIGNVWQSDVGEPEISERIGGEFLGFNMLVIEDNELLRATVCQLLDRWGVNVTQASDGDRGLALVAEGVVEPDLVLIDYRLPNGRAGTEVLAAIRAILGEDLPGIVATADTDPALIASIRAGGLPVLIKPISPARLRSAMHHLLYEQSRAPAGESRL